MTVLLLTASTCIEATSNNISSSLLYFSTPTQSRLSLHRCPVYIIHGTEDGIVPFYHGEGLFNALPDTSKAAPFWAKGAGHNDIEVGMPTAYIKRLQQFVRKCDQVNYPPGQIQRPKAFSSTGTSGSKSRPQEELGRALPGRKHNRQMSASKQRKKKDTLVTNRGVHRYSSSASTNNMVATTPIKTKTRYHHPKSQDRSSSYHNPQQQQQHLRQQQYHYPSVMQNYSTDAAICGIQPGAGVESKRYAQHL